MEHELIQNDGHWECTCGEWARMDPSSWAEHAEEDPE